MKRYSTLHPLVMSFFSPKIYRDVAYAWRGACILYLLILVALTQIPFAVGFQTGARRFAREEAPRIVAQIPRMQFDKGVLQTEENRPYLVKDPDSGKLLAIIDASGATTSLEGTDAEVLFERSRVSVRKSDDETRIYDYSTGFQFTVTRERIARILGWIERYAAAILYACSVVMVVIYRLLQALIFSLAGILLARALHARLPYAAVFRLTVTAMTPAIVIGTIRSASGLHPIPSAYGLLLFLALILGYLIFAVKACAGEASA